MAKIAILGFGTVGSGVYEVLCRNASGVSRRAGEPVEVKYILDPKDFSAHPAANLFIKNFDTILEDPEIRVVVETIGGTRFAYPYVKACLESGRSVCTSNKEMVATYGAELLALAKAHNCAFLFEASVGGGTPIITPMHQCLAANVITEVEGIVNGTTNFMLTKMVRENLGFDEALKIAQELGYAETKDPGDDVDGRDACRKIAILSSLVCGHQIYPQNIPTRGIRDITVAARNMTDYEGTIETVFERYSIPAYLSRRSSMLEKPVWSLITGVLSALENGLEYEDMFRWLKTGLAGLMPEECDELENYVLTWEIHGKMWLRDVDWTDNPDGYGAPWDKRRQARLDRVNELRRRVRAPLAELYEGLKAGVTAGEKVNSLYSFLEHLNLQNALEEQMRAQAEAGRLQDAEETARLMMKAQPPRSRILQCADDLIVNEDDETALRKRLDALSRIWMAITR